MKQSNSIMAGVEHELQLRSVEIMFFEFGMKEKEVAKNMNVSRRTIQRWVKAKGWQSRIARVKETGFKDMISFVDSNTKFLIWLQAEFPEIYKAVSPKAAQYKEKRLNEIIRLSKIKPECIKELLTKT